MQGCEYAEFAGLPENWSGDAQCHKDFVVA